MYLSAKQSVSLLRSFKASWAPGSINIRSLRDSRLEQPKLDRLLQVRTCGLSNKLS